MDLSIFSSLTIFPLGLKGFIENCLSFNHIKRSQFSIFNFQADTPQNLVLDSIRGRICVFTNFFIFRLSYAIQDSSYGCCSLLSAWLNRSELLYILIIVDVQMIYPLLYIKFTILITLKEKSSQFCLQKKGN